MRNRMRCLFLIALILSLLLIDVYANDQPSEVTSTKKDTNFLGLGWELSGLIGSSIDTSTIDSLSFTVTYGRKSIFRAMPVRLRVGAGWWPKKPFGLIGGIEVALLEKLSEAKTRGFGIYLFGDTHLRFTVTGINVSFEPSLRLLVPLTSVGGLGLGVGYDISRGLTFKIESLGGLSFP